MSGERGQVTAFFLLGLAVVFVFIIILLLRNALLARTSAQVTSQTYDARLVQGYVEGCMDLAANEGFTLLGRQGGLLFATQGGRSNQTDPFAATVSVLDASGQATSTNVTIAFGLINNSDSPFRPPFPFVNRTEDTYPFPGVTLNQIIQREATWQPPYADGAFDQYGLSPLCDPEGANNGSSAAPRCPTMLFPLLRGRINTQTSFATFISGRVRQCIDPAELSKLLGANVMIASPNVTVTFTRSETLVALDLPLSFTTEGSALRMSSFSRAYPVRLMRLSWFVFNLLKEASKDPFFHVNDSANYSRVPDDDGFVVTQQHLSPAAVAGRQDVLLVTVADPASKVDQATWFFQFLIQERPPVLDDLHDVLLGGASSANISVAALAPDGDELIANLSMYNATTGAWNTPTHIVLAPNTTDERTLYGVFTDLVSGTYNVSVTSLSTGLADWQVFTIT